MLSDGCNPELVKGAEFDGIFEIPIIKKSKKLITDLANDEHYHVGKDMWGNDWHVRMNSDGTQDWARHQNQVIDEGGKNIVPRPWHERTGLNNDPWEDK